ncbi:hypothetical protein [Roseovarius lutimaris]|uniref:hypothetical protein n=1 Tax=Roseovarius lutimaris TaxID=1005928 RepID=UPI00116021FA|nr:hypothetical protein [Roseovarius lutimaris]
MRVSSKKFGVISLVLCLTLSACGGSSSGTGLASDGFSETRSNGAKIIVDGTPINWLVTRGLKHSSGADAALFLFFEKNTNSPAMNTSLSIPQRVALAEKAVSAHPKCEWVGYDSAFHKSLAGNTGRPKSELWVPVKC